MNENVIARSNSLVRFDGRVTSRVFLRLWPSIAAFRGDIRFTSNGSVSLLMHQLVLQGQFRTELAFMLKVLSCSLGINRGGKSKEPSRSYYP